MPFLRVPASCISSPSGTFLVGPTSAASLNVAVTLRGALGSGEWKSRILNILASLHSLRMNVSGSSVVPAQSFFISPPIRESRRHNRSHQAGVSGLYCIGYMDASLGTPPSWTCQEARPGSSHWSGSIIRAFYPLHHVQLPELSGTGSRAVAGGYLLNDEMDIKKEKKNAAKLTIWVFTLPTRLWNFNRV